MDGWMEWEKEEMGPTPMRESKTTFQHAQYHMLGQHKYFIELGGCFETKEWCVFQ
jgi:hypothetical protein